MRSSSATRNHEDFVFHAGAGDGSLMHGKAIGRCVAAKMAIASEDIFVRMQFRSRVPFSHSSAGDEAAAAPEGQIGPEPGSQNSDAVAHTDQKSNVGRAP